jgi:glutamate racemase
MSDNSTAKIGVFDSGVGGLSVLRAIWQTIPELPVIYLADQAHVPYGPRPLEEVRSFAEAISRYLISQGCRIIVVACNAASAAALHHLRARFPAIPIVGMEPAVKPAAEHTQSGVVGVLATPATFQGALYASVVERFASNVRLIPHTCPGLVQQIEAGELDAPETYRILSEALEPMLLARIDTIVLGCTHYPFVIPAIQQIAGPSVRVIDPAPAVAKQTRRQLIAYGLFDEDNPPPLSSNPDRHTRFITTGNVEKFKAALKQLLNIDAAPTQLRWSQNLLE